MTEKKYALKYNFDFESKKEGFTKKEIKEENKGGCDAIIFVSILRGGNKAHDGWEDHAVMSVDGQNEGKSIPDTELFTHLSFLAHNLMQSDEINDWQRKICEQVFISTKEYILSKN